MLSFDDFKNLAINKDLNSNEKVGFDNIYMEKTEKNIFPDILSKLNIMGNNKIIVDIGCGCSKPVLDLIDFSKRNNHTLYLIDSQEMLDNLPEEEFIVKIDCEFPNCNLIKTLISKVDYIIIYSVLHHIVAHSNYINFLDSAIELLKNSGRLLIADLPNITKKKRFLSSENGIKFHQNWANSEEIPQVNHDILEKNSIDDGLIFGILQRYRLMGCESYLLEQKEDLPMNNSREDIMIKKN